MSETIPILDPQQWLHRIMETAPRNPGYLAMYSSLLGGMVTEPARMLVPVDDHLVHRGDGVFETLKCVGGALYNLGPHLDRLQASAEAIGLPVPWTRERVSDIVVQTVRAGGRKDCQVRLLLGRGPGSLGVSPSETIGSQLYVVVSELGPSFMASHPGGATAGFSRLPVKPGTLARVKSCNYLPNVLMKKEAEDAGVDFMLGFDEGGNLAEGATESVALVDHDQRFRIPGDERVLKGTTLAVVTGFAEHLVNEGALAAIRQGSISRAECVRAREVLIIGTTRDVTSAVRLEDQPVGSGKPGPVGQRLAKMLAEDLNRNPARRHPVWTDR